MVDWPSRSVDSDAMWTPKPEPFHERIMARRKTAKTTVSATTILSIGDEDYLLDKRPVASVLLPGGDDVRQLGFLYNTNETQRYIPATIVNYDELADSTRGWKSTAGKLDGEAKEFSASLDDRVLATMVNTLREAGDDVWTEDFLEVIIVSGSKTPSRSGNLRPDTGTARRVVQLTDSDKHSQVRPGPYVIDNTTGEIYAICRLFPDANDCFVRGTVYNEDTQKFEWLSNIDHIPVPSRLAFPEPTLEKPLSGLRFGVKDVIDISGLETGCGSADYRAFYPPRETTAICVQRLLDAGAVMVGKMRTCMWCDGQDPLERFEEPTPINPRGDRFQKPSGSSSGSAAGCASYQWLDFTIGTDTGGSIRHPAAVNGVYGIRPSLGSTGPTSGLICSELTDTTGVFARSARVAKDVMMVIFGCSSDLSQDGANTKAMDAEDRMGVRKSAFRLLYATSSPSNPPLANSTTPQFFSPSSSPGAETETEAGRMFEDFVLTLEKFVGCAREEICVANLWATTHPEETPDNMVEMMDRVYQDVVYRDLAKHTVDAFIEDFVGYLTEVGREGRRPFIEPSTRKRLEYGSNVSDEDYHKAVAKLKTFGAWVSEAILPAPSASTQSKRTGEADEQAIPLLIYPQTWGTPRYRDELVKRDGLFWSGFSPYSLSYASGCPDFTLPIGETKFFSSITGREEHLPVTISLLGPKGCDEVILDLIADLERDRALRDLKSGWRLF